MKTMNVLELKMKLKNREVVLVDVREPIEYEAEHIEGSCHIPLGMISLDKLSSKSQAVVIHCRTGSRSANACEKLLAVKPELEVYNLEGGILAWKEAGFKVKSATGGVIPLERQVKIGAGSIITIGLILGEFVSPGFYFISWFVALGLIFAGVTGWCGMAILLSKMPWNR